MSEVLFNKTNYKQVQIRERKKPIVVLLANERRDDGGHVMLQLSVETKPRGKTELCWSHYEHLKAHWVHGMFTIIQTQALSGP